MAGHKIEVSANSPELGPFVSNSEDDFLKKHKKLDKNNAANIYSRVSTKIVDMITGAGNLNSFKEYLKHTGYVNNLEDENTLSFFRKSIDSRLSQSNLIILVCKHSREDILEHIFDKNVPVLKNNYFNSQNSSIKPGDRDENNHSAFYYAIRSGKNKLVKLLLENWPFKVDLKELEETLAESYEELKLKNVKLAEEVVVFIEERLVSWRFYSENWNESRSFEISHYDIKERVELVVKNIRLLRAEFNDSNFEKFSLRAKFVVQNLNILKRQMRATYRKLPWEEIEFCLVNLIKSQQRANKSLKFFNFFSTPAKLFKFLDLFSSQLTGEAKFIQKVPINQLSKFPPIKRTDAIPDIIKATPGFQELYDDYSKLRDFYSLELISKYLNIALSSDTGKQDKVYVFSRTLQVTAEHLKDTWESPNMSEPMNQLLISSVSKKTRSILMNLRDSPSLSFCFHQKQEFERNFIKKSIANFEKDFDMLNSIISNLLHVTQLQHVVKILKIAASSQTPAEFKKAIEAFDLDANIFWFDRQKKDRYFKSFKHLTELFEDFSKAISNKTDTENSLFSRVKDVLETHQISRFNQFDYSVKILSLKNFYSSIDTENVNESNLPEVLYLVRKALDEVAPNEIFGDLQKLISELFFDYIHVYEGIMCCSHDYEGFIPILNRIFTQLGFGIQDLKWLEELRKVLYQNKYFKKSYANNVSKITLEEEILPEELESFFLKKLAALKQTILSSYEFDRSLIAYRKDKNLQVVVETLLFDVMFVLQSWGSFARNYLLADEAAPLLVGKNLFDFLTRNDPIYDLQPYDPEIAVFFNAKKLATMCVDRNRKIGLEVPNNFAKLNWKFNQDFTNALGQEEMFEAIEKSDFERLKKSLADGAEIFGRDGLCRTALHFAARGSSWKVFERLLDQGVDPELKDVDGETPLHAAVRFKRTEVVKFLVEKKISVNSSNYFKETPLHVAALNGSKEIVQVLLKTGDTSLRNVGTYAPLHCAAINGSKEIIAVLLKKEKSVDDKKLSTKETILHLAAEFGHAELVKFLIDLKADVNHRNKYGKVPLFHATFNGHLEVVKILVSNNASIYEISTDGFSPLFNAIQVGSIEMVRILLERREKLKIFDRQNDAMAMQAAANFGNVEILKLLLSHKFPPDTQDSKGMTPLHAAVSSGHLEVVKVLAEKKARLNLRNSENFTPITTASVKGFEKIVEFLVKNGVSCTGASSPLHIAASHGKEEVAKVLMAQGDDPNRVNILGRTALHFAAEFGKLNIVRVLLEKGVGLNIKDQNGFTPLIHAASSGYDKIVEVLIKAGAHVNATNAIHSTALHMAALKGHLKVVNLLINARAKLNIKDRLHGKTPLHLAVENNHIEIVKILLDHKALISVADSEGLTPLSTACRFDHSRIFRLLIQCGANPAAERSNLLDTAVNFGHKKIIEVLLEEKIIKANDSMPSGLPLLHQATIFEHSDVVELLLENKAEVNRTFAGGTALTAAIIRGQVESIKVLVKFQADPDLHSWFRTREIDSPSAMQAAAQVGSLESLRLIIRHSKKNINAKLSNELMSNELTLLHIAACNKHLEVVKYLVEKGADLNISAGSGEKPIHLAAQAGSQEIIEYFLSQNVDINCTDEKGWTCLHFAVSAARKKMVEFLVGKKIDVNIRSSAGSAALHGAVHLGHADIVEVLLKNGAAFNIKNFQIKEPRHSTADPKLLGMLKSVENFFNFVIQNDAEKCKKYLEDGGIVDAVNDEFFTPLHYACSKGFADIAIMLLNFKGNPNVSSRNGSAPLHYAAKSGNFKVVLSLLAHGAVFNPKTNKGNKPVDLASDQKVSDFLLFIDKSFNKVEENDESVIEDLTKVKDFEALKALFSAKNQRGETIVTLGVKNNFCKVGKLKHGFVSESAKLAKRALDLVNEDKYAEALVAYKILYEKHKEFLGEENPGTLEALMEVADASAHLVNFPEALAMFEKIYGKQKEIFGPGHEVALNSRSSIGFLCYQMGKYEEALEISRETYEKQKEILDKFDHSLLSTLGNLAMVMFDLKRYDLSLQMQNQLLERYNFLFPDCHSGILMAKNGIAMTLAKLERFEEALEVFQTAYKLKKKILGSEHPETLKTVYHQIEVFIDQEKFDHALDCCLKLLETQEKVLGAEGLDTLLTKIRLGDVFFHQEKFSEALKSYTEAIKAMKSVLKPTDPTVEALKSKIQKVMEFMMTFGIQADPKSVDSSIADAARDENSVRRFLDSGFDLNSKDEGGFTLLHHAAANGSLNVVKFLLKQSADYNLRTNKGNTPLHLAVLKNHLCVVGFLLQYVKDTNSEGLAAFINAKTTSSGVTCMHVAAKNGSEAIVRILLKFGAMFDPRDIAEGKKPEEMAQDQNIVKLLAKIEELFADLKNDKNKMKAKLKKLSSNDFAVIINARNGNNETLS